MISKDKFVENLLAIQARAPTYRTGGTGADGTCDCIGLIMGAMYAAGHKKYEMHSSNYFARKQMQNLYPVSRAEHLYAGMIVYKATDDTSGLNARYQPGGRYYNGDMLDYYHVGVVLVASPLAIIHCTSGGGVNGVTVDHTMGKWSYGGMLKGVEYGSEEDPIKEEHAMETYKARVNVPIDETVNMRTGPGTDYPRMAKVPSGAVVDVREEAQGWAQIGYGNQIGYMMSQYLTKVDASAEAADLVTISLPRTVAEELARALEGVV